MSLGLGLPASYDIGTVPHQYAFACAEDPEITPAQGRTGNGGRYLHWERLPYNVVLEGYLSLLYQPPSRRI